VQRFVDASIVGCTTTSMATSRGQCADQRHNPELPTSSWPIRFAKIRSTGSSIRGQHNAGDRRHDRRPREELYERWLRAGVVKASIDPRKGYTLQFVTRRWASAAAED